MLRFSDRFAWVLVGALALAVVALAAGIAGAGPLDPPPPAGGPTGTQKTQNEIEPRTAISSLPYTISAGGSYYLTGDLSGPPGSDGITITADNVRLDMRGFTLDGPGTHSGIKVSGRSVSISDGQLRDWSKGAETTPSADGLDFKNIFIKEYALTGLDAGGGQAMFEEVKIHIGYSSAQFGVKVTAPTPPAGQATPKKSFRRVDIDMAGTAATSIGFDVAAANTEIADSSVKDSGADCVQVTAADTLISNIAVHSCGDDGVYVAVLASGTKVDGAKVSGAGGNGVRWAAPDGVLQNFSIPSPVTRGVDWSGDGGRMSDGSIRSAGSDCIFLAGANGYLYKINAESCGGRGVAVAGDNARIERSSITNSTTTGLSFLSDGAYVDYANTLFCGTDCVDVAAGADNNTLWRITVSGAGGVGVRWAGGAGSIRNSAIRNSGTNALLATPSSRGLKIIWSEFRGNTAAATLLVDLQGTMHEIRESVVADATGGGISATASNVVIAGTTVENNAGTGAAISGNRPVVQDSIFSNNGVNGLQITGADARLVGNYLANNGQHGLYVNGTEADVDNNQAVGNGTTVANGVGIFVDVGASFAVARENAVSSNDTGLVNFCGTCTTVENTSKGNTIANYTTPVGDNPVVLSAAAASAAHAAWANIAP